MTSAVDHIDGATFHGRRGGVENAFRYSIDYVLFDAERSANHPLLFSRNARNLATVQDRDHGGPSTGGTGAAWVREVLKAHGFPGIDRIELLTQPRILGHIFNPVSFWLCRDVGGSLIAVIAEVTNTYRDRHSYLCHHPDLRPIAAEDTLRATKVFHVSPFQPIEGDYRFRFDIRDDRVGIWIDYETENGGLLATLTGRRQPLTNRAILRALWRRPFGSRRVLALIHWQALKLWWKGARFRTRPEPPVEEVSQ